MKPKACEQEGRYSQPRYELYIQKYREGARLLRSATEMMSPAQANDLLEIAEELDELADIIERLRFNSN